MKLISLVLGLLLERFATHVLHLRELRWFDAYYDFGLGFARRAFKWAVYPVLILILAAPTLPVWFVSIALEGPEILWDLAYLSFAVLIVFFCLGPRDLNVEVEEYCAALDSGDTDAAGRVLLEIAESQHPRGTDIELVEDAIFIQATNRIFGVIFWFIVLGPVGAWIFRVSDLLRRRAVFESIRDAGSTAHILKRIEAIYGLLKWIPARLAMLGYMLSGSFDDASVAWRGYRTAERLPVDRRTDEIVALVGKAAMSGFLDEPTNSSAAARNSMRLVTRTLFIWGTVIALLTIFGWAL
jgi:AmpE protein